MIRIKGTILHGLIGDLYAFNGLSFSPRLEGNLIYSDEQAQLNITLPDLRIDFRGMVDIQGVITIGVPAKTIEFSGYENPVGQLHVTIPMAYMDMSGEEGILGEINVSLPRKLFSGTGNINVTGTLNVELASRMFNGTILSGSTGTIAISIPAKAVAFTGYSSIEGQLTVSLPMLWVKLRELVSEYASMVMNIKNQGLTNYTNYKFNSLCEFNGTPLGATPTGIHDLSLGTTDNGTEVNWNIKPGYLDMEQGKRRRLVEAWVSCKTSGDIRITVIQPDGQEYEYVLNGIYDTETGIRVKFGRGLRSKYISLNIEDINGSSIALDELKLHLMDSGFVKVR